MRQHQQRPELLNTRTASNPGMDQRLLCKPNIHAHVVHLHTHTHTLTHTLKRTHTRTRMCGHLETDKRRTSAVKVATSIDASVALDSAGSFLTSRALRALFSHR